MSFTVIVHPTDLGAPSENAFYHALKIGVAARAELLLVHAHTYGVEQAPGLDDFPHVRRTLALWGLLPQDAAQKEVSEKLGLYVSKGEMLAGNPEAAMAKLLMDRRADFAVLGTRGLEGLQRLREPSFSEALVRDTKIPALFVPEGVQGFVDPHSGNVRLRNILAPVTEQPDPAGAIEEAIGLSDLLGQPGRLHVLHVGPEGSMPAVQVAADRPKRVLERQGGVVDTIVQVADELDADLIVMATAGHKGLLDALRGSTTEGVIRKARRPVLAIPER